jgi:hypothetical protein
MEATSWGGGVLGRGGGPSPEILRGSGALPRRESDSGAPPRHESISFPDVDGVNSGEVASLRQTSSFLRQQGTKIVSRGGAWRGGARGRRERRRKVKMNGGSHVSGPGRPAGGFS